SRHEKREQRYGEGVRRVAEQENEALHEADFDEDEANAERREVRQKPCARRRPTRSLARHQYGDDDCPDREDDRESQQQGEDELTRRERVPDIDLVAPLEQVPPLVVAEEEGPVVGRRAQADEAPGEAPLALLWCPVEEGVKHGQLSSRSVRQVPRLEP